MVIASTQFRLPKFQFDFPAICYMGEVNLIRLPNSLKMDGPRDLSGWLASIISLTPSFDYPLSQAHS